MTRWVIYNFDTMYLLTAMTFESYEDAAEYLHGYPLGDVLILPLQINEMSA